MAYGSLLASLAKGGGGPPPMGGPPPAAMGAGMGPPPALPGALPPPTGLGAMPTGDPSTTKKAAADQAILALREAGGHYPSLKPMLDSTVDALKAAATGKGGAAPGGPPPDAGPLPPAMGDPAPPGAPAAGPTPVMDSGAAGPM